MGNARKREPAFLNQNSAFQTNPCDCPDCSAQLRGASLLEHDCEQRDCDFCRENRSICGFAEQTHYEHACCSPHSTICETRTNGQRELVVLAMRAGAHRGAHAHAYAPACAHAHEDTPMFLDGHDYVLCWPGTISWWTNKAQSRVNSPPAFPSRKQIVLAAKVAYALAVLSAAGAVSICAIQADSKRIGEVMGMHHSSALRGLNTAMALGLIDRLGKGTKWNVAAARVADELQREAAASYAPTPYFGGVYCLCIAGIDGRTAALASIPKYTRTADRYSRLVTANATVRKADQDDRTKRQSLFRQEEGWKALTPPYFTSIAHNAKEADKNETPSMDGAP